MTEPVFERAWHEITSHLPHHHQHINQEGPSAMSILDNLKTELASAETKTAEVYNHVKTTIETHLPAIEATIQAVENEPFIQALLGAQLAIPEHLVNIALDFLGKLVAVSPAAAAAPADAAPAADPAAQVAS
jgi:hypothetical protein